METAILYWGLLFRLFFYRAQRVSFQGPQGYPPPRLVAANPWVSGLGFRALGVEGFRGLGSKRPMNHIILAHNLH